MRLKSIFIFIFILIIPFSVFSFELEGINLIAGNAIILNAEPVEVSSAPSPTAFLLGVSVPMTFTKYLYFEPGLRFYKTIVVLSGDKAVPAAIETKDRVSVLNCELRPEIGSIFHISETIDLGLTGAPVFTFRFPIKAYDDAEELGYPALISSYYIGAARFLGLYAGGFFSWTFGERSALRIKLGTNLPVYHLWDGDEIGFYDQLVIEPELGMVFRF